METLRQRTRKGSRLLSPLAIVALALVCTVALGIVTGEAMAAQVTLTWDANTEPDLAGYKVYYGTAPGAYGTPIDVGNVTTYTVTGLADGQTYYFAATAYDTVGNESGYSNEVAHLTPSLAEMNLVGNSVSIVDGDATPAAADHTDFGSADVAGGTVTRTFTIQNTGAAALTLSGTPLVAVGGANAADFAVTVLPSASVAAAGATSFQVRFDPSAAGARTATLSIASNDADENPYNFAIQGTGTTAPEINLVGNSVSIVDGDATPAAADHTDFGSADIAGGTVTRTFTIQNTGSGALTLSGTPLVVVGGTHAADFAVTVLPSASVAAAASTTFQVRFDPSAAGTRTATLSIAGNDADENPYNFAIQGAGSAAPEINLVGGALSIVDGDATPSTADDTDFGKTKLTNGTVTRTFTIQNTGSGALTLSGTPLVAVGGAGAGAADFAVVAQPAASVAAGASVTFQVRFDPSVAGTRTASLTIFSNDADEATYDIMIQGVGVAPPGAPRNVRLNP